MEEINVEKLKAQAREGDGFACFQLGKAYMDGKMSLEIDRDKGFYWYSYGTKTKNNGLCLYCLGNILENGKCGFKDYMRANELFIEAYEKIKHEAEKDEMNALFYLGNYYLLGKANIEINYEKAFSLFIKSACMGKTAAQNNVAFMYMQGLGVEESMEKAIYWYSLASKAGLSIAKEMVDIIENIKK